MSRFSVNAHRMLLSGAAAVLLLAQPVFAEDVSESSILKALTPAKTRSLSIGAPQPQVSPAEASFVDSVRNKNSRSLSTGERTRLQMVAETKPNIDLAMEFDYNSDVLKGKALETANALGKALTSPDLQGQTFMIAGHTDAKGGDELNQKLSERRAEAVKRFLVTTYQIPAANLISVGYGKQRLKNTSDPFAAENRRVQAVNMLQVKTAGR
ncbi:OmpA family protein [Methylobacterium sp. sgz302541]|uniref:OmpA family protein n=1 Tax=unclassified Methylobacterium TaxID=2615210 RepID=UPI003D32F329